MARKLILVRHANSLVQPDVPAHLWGLSSLGEERSYGLAGRLADFHLARVITSKEPKAIETGRILAQSFRIECKQVAGIEEHHRIGVPFHSQIDQFYFQMARFFRNPQSLVYGDETAEKALQRFTTTIEYLIERYSTGNLCVVSHGTVITLFISYLTDVEPFGFWKRLGMPAYIVLGLPDFQVLNIVEHIPEENQV